MKLIWALLASVLLSGSFFPSPVKAAEPRKMVVPYTPLQVPHSFLDRHEAKLFQKYGLEITPVFVAGSSTIVAAMTSGQFEIGAVGGGE
jgi:ABC-type nitrate/sulfonate/bicarbonate transport system substrate-binding protein